jgi:hypothetical protein
MSDMRKVPPFEISSDGVTVWINEDRGLIARFGRMGIDIHRTREEDGCLGICLFCTQKRATADDWDLFVAKVMEHYGIEVDSKFRPERFSEGKFNV